MQVGVQQAAPASFSTELLLVTLFEEAGLLAALDTALGGQIHDLRQTGDIKGKPGELTLLYTAGAIPARRLLLVGLGKEAELDRDALRRAAAAAEDNS